LKDQKKKSEKELKLQRAQSDADKILPKAENVKPQRNYSEAEGILEYKNSSSLNYIEKGPAYWSQRDLTDTDNDGQRSDASLDKKYTNKDDDLEYSIKKELNHNLILDHNASPKKDSIAFDHKNAEFQDENISKYSGVPDQNPIGDEILSADNNDHQCEERDPIINLLSAGHTEKCCKGDNFDNKSFDNKDSRKVTCENEKKKGSLSSPKEKLESALEKFEKKILKIEPESIMKRNIDFLKDEPSVREILENDDDQGLLFDNEISNKNGRYSSRNDNYLKFGELANNYTSNDRSGVDKSNPNGCGQENDAELSGMEFVGDIYGIWGDDTGYLKKKSWIKDEVDFDENFLNDSKGIYYEFFDSRNRDVQQLLDTYNGSNLIYNGGVNLNVANSGNSNGNLISRDRP
jgi:hypothetical protein